MSFRKLGSEFILGVIMLPWVVFVTVSIFSLSKADAVQETKQDYTIKVLEEVRTDVKSIKEK